MDLRLGGKTALISGSTKGIGFAVAGWFQLLFAALVLLKPSRPLLVAGIVVNATLIAAWAVSRTTGFPFGPNAGLTEVLIPAGYVTEVYDPVYTLSADRRRYLPEKSNKVTKVPAPGLPFSLVFRAEPEKEDVLLRIASEYEAASKRRIPPPAFGPLPATG